MRKYLFIFMSIFFVEINTISFAQSSKLANQIIAINHVCITIQNVKTMLHFYHKILGFKIISNGIRQGRTIEKGTGLTGAKLRNIKLKGPKGFIIEMIHYINPKTQTFPRRSINTAMINHIAFQVKDVNAVYRLLTKQHIKCISAPVSVKSTGAVFFYAYDPEGNIIEFFH